VAAFFGALFFALHPLRAEAVCWLTARRELTGGFFALLSVLLYLDAAEIPSKKLRAWSVLSFLAAVLCRESEAALFPALIILDIYPLKRLTVRFWQKENRSVLIEKIPYFAVALFGATIAVIATKSTNSVSVLSDAGFGQRLAQAAEGFLFYISKAIVPIGLSPVYELQTPTLRVIAGNVLIIAAVLGGAAAYGRRLPGLLSALAVYAAFIFPTLGFARTISYAYDRFSYLACLGFAALLAWAIYRLANRARTAVYALATCCICALAAASFIQSRYWIDSLSLWQHAMSVKAGPIALQNRGQAYLSAREYHRAAADFEEAIIIHPTDFELWRNLGAASLELNDNNRALESFSSAIALNPADYESNFGLALALGRAGKNDAALKGFENCITNAHSNRQRYLAYSGRGAAYFQLRSYNKAIADFSQASILAPENPQPVFNLAKVYDTAGNKTKAVELYKEALKLDSNYFPALLALSARTKSS
jgi:tetratricopeptide (TPR) repeat protein